ncbi:MAG: Trk system potassium transporter TrkH [Thermodesulfobacteriota bacterium]|nr:MAG: Trk system potassium transporter TrkH [Thermodesulfobacteriota bacterium]
MNFKLIFHIVGTFLKFFGLLLFIPAICSLIYKDGDLHIFITTAVVTVISGLLLEILCRESIEVKELNRKEAFFIALSCWIVASVFGAIPYFLMPIFSSPIDALFESISGYTTTGATILTEIESLPHGILFYRSFTQWLGGMGIIVLGIAILPKLSVGGVQLMGTESPGPIMEKITPKIAETAKKLWFVYIALSLLLIVLLLLSDMPIFDSIVTSFSTLSTGGFSIKNSSIEGYNSSLIEAIITLFMFLAGINFLVHYYAFTGKFSKIAKNSELKFYALLAVFFVLVVSVDLWSHHYPNYFDALRHSSFQVVSILTTTGFNSVDFDIWTEFSVFLLFVLMFIGACSGSTSGSVKVLRILILIKNIFVREINKLVKPNAVLLVKVNNRTVPEAVIASVTSFFLLYMLVFVVSVLVILAVEDISLMGALSACAATIGNVGPGFEEVGATHNYDFLSGFSKLWLCLLMLLGRLELFTVFVIFTPIFWRK